jgi:general secretion pathway protein M
MSAASELQGLKASLSTSFSTLTQRERRLVVAAGVAVSVFVIFMVLFSFSSKADGIRRRTQEKLLKLEEVQALAGGYRDRAAAQEALERQLQASNVRLISYLEEKSKKAGLELPSFNPKPEVPLEGSRILENAVELTLTDVKLNRLVDFLTAVEAGPGLVKVKHLRLEPRIQNETVTAWLTVVTYHTK